MQLMLHWEIIGENRDISLKNKKKIKNQQYWQRKSWILKKKDS